MMIQNGRLQKRLLLLLDVPYALFSLVVFNKCKHGFKVNLGSLKILTHLYYRQTTSASHQWQCLGIRCSISISILVLTFSQGGGTIKPVIAQILIFFFFFFETHTHRRIHIFIWLLTIVCWYRLLLNSP